MTALPTAKPPAVDVVMVTVLPVSVALTMAAVAAETVKYLPYTPQLVLCRSPCQVTTKSSLESIATSERLLPTRLEAVTWNSLLSGAPSRLYSCENGGV